MTKQTDLKLPGYIEIPIFIIVGILTICLVSVLMFLSLLYTFLSAIVNRFKSHESIRCYWT